MAFKKKPPPPRNFITSSADSLSKLSATVVNNGVKVNSPAEIKAQKSEFLSMIKTASGQFVRNLNAGNVELSSTLDLERLVKLFLVLSGEASEIQGQSSSVTSEIEQRMTMTRIDEILNDDDPMVNELFQKLYDGYNQLNDAANEETK